jgi:amidase
VTRGTSNNLWSPQSVQGPMARNVADLALFLDTMAGFCPHDPMTFDAPAVSFSAAVANPVAPKRVAWTPTSAAASSSTARSARSAPRRRALRGAGLHRRGGVAGLRAGRRGVHGAAQPAVRRRPRAAAQEHRDKIKPDIIWNTELA